MVYIYLFIAIAFFTLVNGLYGNKDKIMFIAISTLLTLMSMFRYGSGTDFFGYMWHYNQNPNNITDALELDSHMDIGYKIIMTISKSVNMEFEDFILIISLFMMTLFIYTIIKNSKFPILSLMIFYGFYYLVYITSSLRQGIAMTIFFWAFYRYYKKEKYLIYIIFIIIASTFHKSVLITLLIFMYDFLYKKYFINSQFNIMIGMFSILFFLLKGEKIVILVCNLLGIEMNYSSSGANLMAILLKIILVIFMFILYRNSDGNIEKFDEKSMYIYYLNAVFFISISNISTLSRLTEYMCLLDIIICANFVYAVREKLLKLCSILFLILLTFVVFRKDLAAALVEGGYYTRDIKKYPYISVFNEKEEIYNHREVRDIYKVE